jgi:hypothetical protein
MKKDVGFKVENYMGATPVTEKEPNQLPTPVTTEEARCTETLKGLHTKISKCQHGFLLFYLVVLFGWLLQNSSCHCLCYCPRQKPRSLHPIQTRHGARGMVQEGPNAVTKVPRK